MAAHRIIPAASIVVFRGDSLLLARRGEVWAPPGGKIEPGESAEQAALRELLEETGVTARIIGHAGDFEVERPEAIYKISCFTADWVAGEAHAVSEIAEARFFPPDAARKLPLSPKARDGILAAMKAKGIELK